MRLTAEKIFSAASAMIRRSSCVLGGWLLMLVVGRMLVGYGMWVIRGGSCIVCRLCSLDLDVEETSYRAE